METLFRSPALDIAHNSIMHDGNFLCAFTLPSSTPPPAQALFMIKTFSHSVIHTYARAHPCILNPYGASSRETKSIFRKMKIFCFVSQKSLFFFCNLLLEARSEMEAWLWDCKALFLDRECKLIISEIRSDNGWGCFVTTAKVLLCSIIKMHS